MLSAIISLRTDVLMSSAPELGERGAGAGDFPFAVPAGDYYEYAMRSFSVSSHWKLWLTINRV